MTKYYINIMTNTRLTLTTFRIKKLENINDYIAVPLT